MANDTWIKLKKSDLEKTANLNNTDINDLINSNINKNNDRYTPYSDATESQFDNMEKEFAKFEKTELINKYHTRIGFIEKSQLTGLVSPDTAKLFWMLGEMKLILATHSTLTSNQIKDETHSFNEEAEINFSKAIHILNQLKSDKHDFKLDYFKLSQNIFLCKTLTISKNNDDTESIKNWLLTTNYLEKSRYIINREPWNWRSIFKALRAVEYLEEEAFDEGIEFTQKLLQLNLRFNDENFQPAPSQTPIRKDPTYRWVVENIFEPFKVGENVAA